MKSLLYQAALKKRPHGLQNFMGENIFDHFVLILKIIIKSRTHQSHFISDFLNADPVQVLCPQKIFQSLGNQTGSGFIVG